MSGNRFDEYDTDELEQKLDEEIADRNDWHEKHGGGGRPYGYELDTHYSGVAVELYKDSGACKEQSGMVCHAALECGFVVSEVKFLTDRDNPKTCIFLRDLSDMEVRITK
jgi:hypothetical protein